MSQSNPIPVPRSNSSRLETLIIDSHHIPDMDKSFLLSKLPELKPLDRLHLEQAILGGLVPESLLQIAKLRQKFMAQENPPKPNDVLTRLVQTIAPPAAKVLLSQSILLKQHFSGSPAAQAISPKTAPTMIRALTEFNNLDQLAILNPAHVTFSMNDPTQQILENFFTQLEKLLGALPDMNQRRGYLMTFMQSILFNIYLNTGITALRHPELQPRSIALNQMYQIDNRKYLNKAQFQYTSQITNHLRGVCGL